MSATMGRSGWIWIPMMGLGACSSDWVEPDAANAGPVGGWVRCCGLESSPFVRTRGSGSSLECFCDARSTCNWEQTCWERDAWLDEPDAVHDAGFVEAGPMDDAALDALTTSDAGVDESTDVGAIDDAGTDAFTEDGGAAP